FLLLLLNNTGIRFALQCQSSDPVFFSSLLGPFFYANMAPETAASGHSLQQRTASQPASQEDPPFAHFGFVLPKWPRALLDCIARALHLSPDPPASPGASVRRASTM